MAEVVAEADFETTTREDDCRVWAWAVAYADDVEQVFYGEDIDSFLLFCARRGTATYYFHNLAFDGRFIVDRLLRLGYEHTCERMPRAGQLTTLVSNKGKFYQVAVRFWSGVYVRFRDSLKLFPMSAAAVARTFELPEGKGTLDYAELRERGHRLTEEERDYIRRDVQIVAQALAFNASQGLRRMTIGANAMGFYRDMVGRRAFEHWFPTLSGEVDGYLRQAYRGGFTYVEPFWAGRDCVSGISVDYNSMYPSMLVSRPYPVGRPVPFLGRYEPMEGFPLYVQSLTCTFSLRPRGVPMVQLRNSGFYGQHEYVERTVEPCSLTLTSVDLELFLENYDVDVLSWDGGMAFAAEDGAVLFGDYVEHWGEVKRTSRGGMRQLAKLMLNNLYGKFGTNPDVTRKVPRLDPETDTVVWELGEREVRDPVYVPVAAFCTAWARDTLIRAIMANRDRFVYCDTDSMHLRGTWAPDGIRLHDTDLCAWKVEGEFWRARHLRAKCYIWDLNHKVSVTCAGMPENVKALCTYDNFWFGFSNLEEVETDEGTVVRVKPGYGKLRPKAVPGGVVLVEGPYEMKA